MHRLLFNIAAAVLVATPFAEARADGFSIRGKVIDRLTRQGIPYAAVVIYGQEEKGVATDSLGVFRIDDVQPGICRLQASSLGYREAITPEYAVSASTPFVEIELNEDSSQLDAITVTPSPLRRTPESPVSVQVISLRDIEKSPGANRDISRIVRSYPGVAFSPVGYRNDLIVRGGGPSENVFFMDGIEIPNINHFATQGASGGPVSIVNSDLVREINFYTGAFPADRAGALSSVLDFRLKDGDAERQTFKATLGASEAAFSGSGHIGKRTTYLFSLRQSYLQLLFKLLGLPFLPNYIDGQIKVRTRIGERDELVILGLTGIDNMRLNEKADSESNEYILGYLPRLWQETFTLGATYRHFKGRSVQSVSLSYSYINNRNQKYRNNDTSSEENLILKLRAIEGKATLRADNRTYLGLWTVRAGAEVTFMHYRNTTLHRIYQSGSEISSYMTSLGIAGWGGFVSADYKSANERMTASMGIRFDGSSYSPSTSRFWRQTSPRISFSYTFDDHWSAGANGGIYYRLPPFTALGFKEEGVLVNRGLDYMRVISASAGANWHNRERISASLELFYKHYSNIPLSVADGIPLTCKGNDYGTVGDERLVSSAVGRSYGVEMMARWQIPGRLNIVGSATVYSSEYRSGRKRKLIDSAWDNRFVINVSGTYDFKRGWSVGAKVSAIGGAPYTPYDVALSSLVEAWDATGRPYYDYTRYNSERLGAFAQLDIRADKVFYFKRWMLGIYVDLQNVTFSKIKLPDVLVSTGVIENPTAPPAEQRYVMKSIKQESGTIIPTIGITAEF